MPLPCHPISPPLGGGAQVATNELYFFARVRQAAISNDATPPPRGAPLSARCLPQKPQVPLSSTRMPMLGILGRVGGVWAAPRGLRGRQSVCVRVVCHVSPWVVRVLWCVTNLLMPARVCRPSSPGCVPSSVNITRSPTEPSEPPGPASFLT